MKGKTCVRPYDFPRGNFQLSRNDSFLLSSRIVVTFKSTKWRCIWSIQYNYVDLAYSCCVYCILFYVSRSVEISKETSGKYFNLAQKYNWICSIVIVNAKYRLLNLDFRLFEIFPSFFFFLFFINLIQSLLFLSTILLLYCNFKF